MWDNPRQLDFVSGLLTAFSVVMLVVALVAWAARQPAFAIRKVVFAGELAHVNPLHLRRIVSEELSGNFFTLNLDRARAAFVRVPWVREASVRRRWPDRLEVELAEHRPLARWNGTSLVDVQGEVFDARYDGELPALGGPEGSAREVTAAYYRFGAALAPISRGVSELRLSRRRAWTIRLDNGLDVDLGRDDADARLARLIGNYRRTIAPLVRDGGLGVDRIDLRYRNGFAVHVPGLREPATKRKGRGDSGPTQR